MKFSKVTVISSCMPGFKMELGELAIWFDGDRAGDPVYLAWNDPDGDGTVRGWVEWKKGTSIEESLADE